MSDIIDAYEMEFSEEEKAILRQYDPRRPLRSELFVLLLGELHKKARVRYGYTWVYMIKVFIARAYPSVDPLIITQLALLACEQVLKMAEVAYDTPLQDRSRGR